MKNLLIIVFTFFASYILNAQVLLIDDFTLSATEGAYGVYTDMDCEVENIFYIDMQAPDARQHVQMRLLGKFLNSFVSSLRDAKEIYNSWSKVAKENHITFLSKDIKVSVPDKTLYFTDEGKWYLEHGVDLKCTFMVTQDGACYLVLQSDDLTSSEAVAHGYSIGHFNLSSGRWGSAYTYSTTSIIKYCPGASLTFSSTEEIEMFIQKVYAAKEWKDRNIEQGKLFK